MIFVLGKNDIKDIYVNYSNSNIVLSFTDFVHGKLLFNLFKHKITLKNIDLFLNIIIFNGWKEILYLYKEKCYKVCLIFDKKRKPLIYKISFFDNLLFYCGLFANYIFKELESTNLDTNSFVEEEFIISPIERDN